MPSYKFHCQSHSGSSNQPGNHTLELRRVLYELFWFLMNNLSFATFLYYYPFTFCQIKSFVIESAISLLYSPFDYRTIGDRRLPYWKFQKVAHKKSTRKRFVGFIFNSILAFIFQKANCERIPIIGRSRSKCRPLFRKKQIFVVRNDLYATSLGRRLDDQQTVKSNSAWKSRLDSCWSVRLEPDRPKRIFSSHSLHSWLRSVGAAVWLCSRDPTAST